MADVYAVNYDAFVNDQVAGRNQVAPTTRFGRQRIMHDSYEAAALADGSVILMGPIPEGAVVKQIAVYCDALGGGVTLAVGDNDDTVAADPDRYIEATSAAAAATILMSDALHTVIDKIPYTIGKAGVAITITVAGGVATGTIEADITYAVD